MKIRENIARNATRKSIAQFLVEPWSKINYAEVRESMQLRMKANGY